MKTHTYEVVKEFVFIPEAAHGLTIRGRIVRNLDPQSSQPYSWQVSHRWKARGAGGFYYPSATSGQDIGTVQQLLFAYAQSFTDEVEVKEDKNY